MVVLSITGLVKLGPLEILFKTSAQSFDGFLGLSFVPLAWTDLKDLGHLVSSRLDDLCHGGET